MSLNIHNHNLKKKRRKKKSKYLIYNLAKKVFESRKFCILIRRETICYVFDSSLLTNEHIKFHSYENVSKVYY